MIKKIIFLFAFLSVSGSLVAQDSAKIQAMISDLDPRRFNKDFSNYDQRTSLYCAQLSELVYWDAPSIELFRNIMTREYPNEQFRCKFISFSKKKGHHKDVLLWSTKDFLVVSFRGTEPKKIKDWIADAKYWNYRNSESSNERLANMPPGHGGFRKALINLITERDLFGEINSLLRSVNPSGDAARFPIYLTGHSLGAAISQLFIEPLNYRGLNFSGAYHFAPPLAVSCEYRDTMITKYGNKVYDIVNYKDYVPRAGRNNVAHFGKFYRICTDGLVYKEEESYVKFKFREYKLELDLHSLDTHIKWLRKSENDVFSINQRSAGRDTPCMDLPGKPWPVCVEN